MAAHPLRVLESFRQPSGTTNPYLHLLLEALRECCTVSTFTWSRAMFGRYDVLHVHWPEVLLRGSSRARTWVRRFLFLTLIARSWVLRVAVVRTVHNQAPHERPPVVDRVLLELCERATTWRILINDSAAPAGRTTTVLHGHYRDWFADAPARHDDAVPGRIVFVGLVRPYKNVPDLARTFAQLPDDHAVLHIRGKSPSAALREEVLALAAADPRIDARLEHLGDDEMVAEVRAAHVVVLPYRDLTNSGVALLALSLGRPVLVPRNEVTDRLAAEVGEAWVRRYEETLSAGVLAQALDVHLPTGEPDLDSRSWRRAATLHRAAFEDAVRCRSGRRSRVRA